MSNTATLPEGTVIVKGRLSYPKLWEAKGINGDPTSKPRFGCAILLPKTDTATQKKLSSEIDRLTKLHFKGVRPKSKDLFIKDGDGEDADKDGHSKGCWIISANRAESQGRPQVIDRNRAPLHPSDNKPYAGCVCNFVISIFVPKNWNKITASLEVVQFVADGEPFGGGRVDTSVLPDLEEGQGDGFDV
jgi:hypothetical protein